MNLQPAIRPVVRFAYITGWRIASEVLPLQWRHVDFEARVVRLDPHTTKNDEGRTFPFTEALAGLLEGQRVEHDALLKTGVLCPWVFHRQKGKGPADRVIHQGIPCGMHRVRLSGPDSARFATDRRSEPRPRRHS